MDKMLIATFDEEKKAYEGSRILKDLDAEGSLTVYATAVIGKDASGKLRWAGSMVAPSARITARSTQFCSSRTLPGHE